MIGFVDLRLFMRSLMMMMMMMKITMMMLLYYGDGYFNHLPDPPH